MINPKFTAWYYAQIHGRDYITPEDIGDAINAGADKHTLQQEVLEFLGRGAIEDWTLCAFVASKFEKSGHGC